MKNHYKLYSIAIIVALNLFITASLSADRINTYKNTETYSSLKKQETSYQSEPEGSKSDSLPEGVTQDWLNSLRDENGNRIIPESGTENSRVIPVDPEGDAMQRKIFNGFNTNDRFGWSVSTAGDVNGDGYDDIIVGASRYISNTGRAYIYFGGIYINTTPDVILTGETVNSQFGSSVSSAGDVNGDGYSDVIVGAEVSGRAYIYFGGAVMNNSDDVKMTGLSIPSVSSAGDVNGDGYSDVIVGASGYSSSTGRAYIFFGGASMNNTADVTMTGEAVNNFFGRSVSAAGDVNGDGYSDVIVGADGNSANAGRAYVFFGGAVMNNSADVTLTGEAANERFGRSVSTAGDVNGDGYTDLIIGAFQYSSSTGRAYIFYGGTSMDIVADVTITGEVANSNFGFSVSTAGDVNSDGYSDMIVGADGYSANTGRAYIFFGGTSMNNIADVTITGEALNDRFGRSVFTAGDVNGDGYSDLIVGAWGNSSNTGRAYMYDYYMRNEIIPNLTMTGEAVDIEYGISVSTAGDVNGDGYSDVIVGAIKYSSYTGRAYIYFGGIIMDSTADITMTGEAVNNNFGSSVSSAGDLNGDGYSDVIVGAERYSTYTGRVYIYFGGAVMNNSADVTMTGDAANSLFGCSVSSAGDVNSDGYSDAIVGAKGYSSNGRAYIFYGGAVMNNASDITINGDINSNFGNSVSTAGDLNGDGYSDVIIGAQSSATRGRAFVFFGGVNMNIVDPLILVGEEANNLFGHSVSFAGDLNGDGYPDVIVGASGYSSNTGRAYVFFGGTGMDNTADLTMTGLSSNNYFGNSVSTAGDMNGDGFSDVIVGESNSFSSTGRAYVFFGGAEMNNVSDVTMAGEEFNDLFGWSVYTAGDVNGDGYSDVIVGALGNSSNINRANTYYGSAISAKPILNYVKDVPNDQGGILNLKFAKNLFDVPFSEAGGISYQIDRSVPPNANGYQWISIAYIAGTYESFYTAEIHTPQDSGVSGNNTYFFRVTAVSNATGNFWRSNIMSGYSLDNIAPPIVSPFTATAAGSNVTLNWGNNSAPDFLNYVLFRSVNPVIDPYTETPITTVTQTTFTDTSPLSGIYYYFIVAQDIHGNFSPVAITESPGMTLNLTMFIEGFYNSGTDSQVSDTITVELRNSTSPFAVADQSAAVVSVSGSVQFRFGNAVNGNYYVAVKHRNSIETWSSNAIAFSQTTPVNFDLASSSLQAFGNNIIQVNTSPVRFATFSGDVNQDGTIDAADLSQVENDASISLSGYVVTDLTGDDFVDAADLSIVENNAANSVSIITP